MILLGILACRIFEDELIYFIENNTDFDTIIIYNNQNIQETFQKKLENNHLSYILCNTYNELSQMISRFSSSQKILFLNLVELRLHTYPDKLKDFIYHEIESIREKTPIKNVFLYYGLCGNVLGNVEKDFTTSEFQVFILKESNGDIVDDCVGAVLEGRQNYLKLLKSFNKIGTLIQLPMGAITNEQFIFKEYLERGYSKKKAQKLVKKMYEIAHYENILLVDTGLYYTPYEEAKQKAKEHADQFQLKLLEKKLGSQKLFQENYEKIKDHLLTQ